MSTIAVPGTVALKKARSPWVVLSVAVVALLALAWIGRGWFSGATGGITGPFYTIEPIDLMVKVAKDGELQAVNALEIQCKVEGRTLIQTIVDEGTEVKQGDVLVVLDSSAIKQKYDDALLEVESAEAAFTAAQEALEIQRSTNAANLESAKVELLLAELDLEQYTKGTYPQALATAERAVEMAQISLANTEKALENDLKLFNKGFVTAAEIEKSKLDVLTARNELEKVTTELEVLKKYTHQKDLADKRNVLAQAQANLARVQKENASNLAQKIADLRAKEQTLLLRRRKLQNLEEQLAACTVVAPADGLVVYGTTGSRRSENPIQEGAEVREKQVLIRLPDTRHMKAVVRIPEAQVHRLGIGQRALVRIAGHPQPVWATLTDIAVLADSASRWWNPDLKEYPVELKLDETPPGLKPGTGVSVEIFVDAADDALAVPLQALFSTGEDRYVFVKQGNTVEPRKVRVGKSNETHAEIVEGVTAGMQVLLLQVGQGRELLEKAGIDIDRTERRRDRRSGPPGNAPAAASTPKPASAG